MLKIAVAVAIAAIESYVAYLSCIGLTDNVVTHRGYVLFLHGTHMDCYYQVNGVVVLCSNNHCFWYYFLSIAKQKGFIKFLLYGFIAFGIQFSPT